VGTIGCESGVATNVVCMPSWYPSDLDPAPGIWAQEHVKAAALHASVSVLFAQAVPFGMLIRRQIPLFSDKVENGIRTVRVTFPRTWRPANVVLYCASYLLGLIHLRRTFAASLIHAHSYVPAGLAAVICGQICRLPVVITEHFTGFARDTLTRSERAVARWTMNRAAAVICVSIDLKEHIERLGVKTRFWVIPNPVDVDLIRSRGPTTNPVPKIVCVTNLSAPVKNIPSLVEAFAGLVKKDSICAELHIIGDGPLRREVEELVGRTGIRERVVLHGFLSRQELAGVLAGGDLLVIPSLFENCPVSLLEAQVAGLPVVATAVGGIPEVNDPGSGILVEPGNVDALRAGIAEALRKLPGVDRVRIRERALGLFSRESVGRQISEVYVSLLS